MGNYVYNTVPVLRRKRSRFDLSHGIKTSANVGYLVPYDVQEVYPGDTFKVRTACVVRLSSQFIRPIMDNLFLDEYHFFVPSRLLYDKFKNVFGENTDSAWANTQEYVVPCNPAGLSVSSKTVADYMGLPIGQLTRKTSILPFRAFAKIYDEWFRDQNNIAPMHIQTGELASSESFNTNPWAPNNYTGELPNVAKFHDYFTSCLPAPQKGSAVDIPIGGFTDVPVTTGAIHGVSGRGNIMHFGSSSSYSNPMRLLLGSSSGTYPANSFGLVGVNGDYPSSINPVSVVPDNLWAQTSDLQSAGFSVNDLRFAFAYQKMLERDARSGSRYTEYLASHFGVSAGDARLQRSEFLGGKRSPLSLTQVTQTTGSDSNSAPLAQVGAYSQTVTRGRFTKGFVEHGFVISIFCIRQFHTYQQGIERFWTRSARTDFYDPVFANIGEQPVYKSELYGIGSNVTEDDTTPFGYNEAWADMRGRPSRVTGQMRTGVTDTLDVWHLADNYSNAPTLNEQFINETSLYVDRAITVESSAQDQFILDFFIQNIAYRELPVYSVPSLIDHN